VPRSAGLGVVVPANVLYLHHVGELSGAETSLRLLLRHLDRVRMRPLFAGPATGRFPAALVADGVTTLPLTFGPLRRVGGVLGAARRLVGLVRAHSIDLLHANGPQTNVPAGLAGRIAGVPVVWHARNLVAGEMWDVDRALAPLATRIVCNADAIRRRFAGSRGWDRSVTIVNAVDTREFHPGVPRAPFRRELGVPDGAPLFGIVGRVGLGKGHEHFAEAALRLLRGGLDAHFVVVGDPLFDEDAWRADTLHRLVKDAGRDDRVRFVGYRRDVPAVMRGLDVLVLASDAEPCGRVLFEAMASGTAIVATASGGTPEIVRDGVEALLVPPRDPAALAEAMRTLAADSSLRARVGAAGIARVTAHFTIERYVERMLAVYDDALAGRRR
jgi:glycosyltransferase involved in cell wall biosynthesis